LNAEVSPTFRAVRRRPYLATRRRRSPSTWWTIASFASHRRAAVRAMAASTGWMLPSREGGSIDRRGVRRFIAPLGGILTHGSTRGDAPGFLDLAAAYAVRLVDHVADHAAVIGDYAHDLADGGPLPAGGEIDHAVVLGETHDRRLGILHHVTVAF